MLLVTFCLQLRRLAAGVLGQPRNCREGNVCKALRCFHVCARHHARGHSVCCGARVAMISSTPVTCRSNLQQPPRHCCGGRATHPPPRHGWSGRATHQRTQSGTSPARQMQPLAHHPTQTQPPARLTSLLGSSIGGTRSCRSLNILCSTCGTS